MNTHSVIIELLERLEAANSTFVLITDEELSQWPDTAVKALKSQRLITKAHPATSAICPGCEHACIMSVHSLLTTNSKPSFIICDKRNDINRVSIATERLIQWQISIDSIYRFIVTCLGINRRKKQKKRDNLLEVGLFSGKKRSQMICLQSSDGLNLVAGDVKVSCTQLIQYNDGVYSLNVDMIQQMVDSLTVADERYTPSDINRKARKLKTRKRRDNWKKEYQNLRKKRPEMSDKWYSQQIAKMEIANGRSAETIRKNMKM